jgi:lipopolysaccharide export system permease protein
MIAISHTLNKLATDSEIIVMNAAGFSPFRLFRRSSTPPAWWR